MPVGKFRASGNFSFKMFLLEENWKKKRTRGQGCKIRRWKEKAHSIDCGLGI
jgi:hypothetical protein